MSATSSRERFWYYSQADDSCNVIRVLAGIVTRLAKSCLKVESGVLGDVIDTQE